MAADLASLGRTGGAWNLGGVDDVQVDAGIRAVAIREGATRRPLDVFDAVRHEHDAQPVEPVSLAFSEAGLDRGRQLHPERRLLGRRRQQIDQQPSAHIETDAVPLLDRQLEVRCTVDASQHLLGTPASQGVAYEAAQLVDLGFVHRREL